MPRKLRPFRRVGMAYGQEEDYSSTEPVLQRGVLTINAHTILKYAHLRAQVARFVASVFDEHPDSALVGFLTGSVGPTVNARVFIQDRLGLAHRVRYSPGLAHGSSTKSTEPEFHTILDDLWLRGIHHFVFVDEVVSGAQMRTALKSVRRWLRHHGHQGCHLHVVGAYEGCAQQRAQAGLQQLCDEFKDLPVQRVAAFSAQVLLEKDKNGIIFRAIKRGNAPGEYEFRRTRTGGVLIKCPCGGVCQGVGTASSADQLFGGVIAMTIGEMEAFHAHTWPLTIREASCPTCKRLLREARTVYRPLRPKHR